jgi:Kef-type K+ transport system membrane component KefB
MEKHGQGVSNRLPLSASVGDAASPRRRLALLAVYVLMIAAAVAVFYLIRGYGETLAAPSPHSTSESVHTGNVLARLLLCLAAVIILGRVLGWLFTFLGQPPVIGEVMAGILLGPSLLGHIDPALTAWLLPDDAASHLQVIAQLGIILYMFVVGLELNAGLLHGRAHTTVAVSHASIVAPFLLGAALALLLYPRLAPSGVSFTSFALFMGVAMAITAFPVLARILTDRGMTQSSLGVMALACAATDDVTAWCLLALVVGVAQHQVGAALTVIGLALAYMACVFLVIRPIAIRLAARYNGDEPPQGVIAVALVCLLLSALATELIGVHAVFGAFLLGAVIPHDSAIARALSRKLSGLVTIVFLPAFFAFTGMRTQIGLVSGWEEWLLCGLIIVVATAGKFGGALLAGRLTGLSWRSAAALGVLMNTRGLMELIVLNIGLDLGIISPTLFAMMVLMALVTTVMTTPLLRLLVADERSPGSASARRTPDCRSASPART